MTNSNNTPESKSKCLRMLESIEAKGRLFLSIYNKDTRRYELISFAMYMYDCSLYFSDMLLRWKEHLPHLGEAQDVEFLDWKKKINNAIENALSPINSDWICAFTELDKNLCEEEIKGLYAIYKGSSDFQKKIKDMSQYLSEHNADIEQLVVDVSRILTDILGELDDSLLYAEPSMYEDLYNRLSSSWEPNWPALKHDEYDTCVQRWTQRVLKKNIERRIDELLGQFITNQFEQRWQPLINCSSDWDNIYDSESHTIDTQAIGRLAIAHRREVGFITSTMPTLLAFVRLISFMQEQAAESELQQQKQVAPQDPLAAVMQETDFSNIKNMIFINDVKTNGFDYKRLYVVIRDKFLPLLEQKYDWYALWRWCLQRGWLADEKHTSFANQMNDWFPGKVVNGVAASMNDFDQGGNSYLHKTSPREYDINEATKDARKSSCKDYSMAGAKRIVKLCDQLKDILNDVQLKA